MKENTSRYLFYGALWGILEATVGYLMHLFVVPFTGFVMFPIGAYFMGRATLETKEKKGALYVALIAATIKLINLWMPNIAFIKVMNPVIAILLQGLAVSLFLGIKKEKTFISAFNTSLLWRAIFIGFVFIEGVMGYQVRLLNAGTMEVVRYLTLDTLINSVLIVGLFKWSPMTLRKIKPSMAYLAFAAAISINLIV